MTVSAELRLEHQRFDEIDPVGDILFARLHTFYGNVSAESAHRFHHSDLIRLFFRVLRMLIMAGLLIVPAMFTMFIMFIVFIVFIVPAMFIMFGMLLVIAMLLMPPFGRDENDPFAFEHRKSGAFYGDMLFKWGHVYLHLGECVQQKRPAVTLYPK